MIMPARRKRNVAIIQAAKEVGPGLFFSLLIITVSFLPVLALTGQSYRMFSPLGIYQNLRARLCLHPVDHGNPDA